MSRSSKLAALAGLGALWVAQAAPCFPGLAKIQLPGPEDLATRGILVGTFAGGNGKDTDNLEINSFSLVVDDKTYLADYVNDTFLVTLPPGAHRVGSMSFSATKDDYVTNRKVTRTTTFPLGLSANIELGKVTTLGALYLFEKGGSGAHLAVAPSGPYRILHVDNGAFVSQLLERQYPKIYAALADKTLIAAYPYLNEEQFRVLHQVMALDRMRDVLKGAALGLPKSRYTVYGALGMAGHVYTDVGGKPVVFRSFNLDTLASIKECISLGERYACLTQTPWSGGYERLAFAGTVGGKGERLELPAGASPIAAHLFGADGIALGDYNYQLYVRRDSRQPWQTFKQDGVKAGAFVARYVFGDTPTGFFSYYEGNEHALVFTNAAEGATDAVPLPPKFKGGKNLLVTEQRLLIGPEWNLLANSEVYARDLQTGAWTMSKLPASRCDWMGLDTKTRKLIYAMCGLAPGKGYVSEDGGLSWRAE